MLTILRVLIVLVDEMLVSESYSIVGGGDFCVFCFLRLTSVNSCSLFSFTIVWASVVGVLLIMICFSLTLVLPNRRSQALQNFFPFLKSRLETAFFHSSFFNLFAE